MLVSNKTKPWTLQPHLWWLPKTPSLCSHSCPLLVDINSFCQSSICSYLIYQHPSLMVHWGDSWLISIFCYLGLNDWFRGGFMVQARQIRVNSGKRVSLLGLLKIMWPLPAKSQGEWSQHGGSTGMMCCWILMISSAHEIQPAWSWSSPRTFNARAIKSPVMFNPFEWQLQPQEP